MKKVKDVSPDTVYIHTGSLNYKKENAITLVALVITIIIMLILAGIAISSLMENGLFEKTKQAKIVSDYISAKEIVEMKLMEIQAECISKNKEYTIEEIAKKIIEDVQITIVKCYNENVTSIKPQIGSDFRNLKGVVVLVDKYPEYKFLIGESCEIERVTTADITDVTTLEEDISQIFETVESFEKNVGIYISSNKEIANDYIDNLLYKVNFYDIKESIDGVNVDESNVYATFNGQGGITIDADTLDPDRKLIGTTSKTITLWYRTVDNLVSPSENVLASMGNCLREGGGNIIQFYYKQLRTATGGTACHVEFKPDDRFDNNWHFLVAAYENGSRVRGYYDTLEFIGDGRYYTDNAILDIGHLSNTRYYRGDMADIRVYSSALTKDQILQLYKYGQSLLKNK